MKHKFIQNIIQKDNLGVISLYDEIEYWHGDTFSNELRYLANQVDNIDFRINSIGGNVIAAFAIFSTIQDLCKQGKNIVTINDGIAASSAGWLLQAGKERKAADFSLFMMHDPYNPNGETDVILQKFKESIVKILENNSKLTAEQINTMMSVNQGGGTWLNAEQQKQYGLVDSVFSTSLDRSVTNLLKPTLEVSELVNIANSLYKGTQPKNENMKTINNLLGLKDEASPESQIESITALQNKVKQMNETATALATAKTKLAELENKISDLNAEKCSSLVENAIAAKKIKEDQKEGWLKMANTDFDTTKNLLDGMEVLTTAPAGHVNLAELAKGGKQESKISNSAQREKDAKEYENLFKNDAEGLAELKENEPERFELIKNAYADYVNNKKK